MRKFNKKDFVVAEDTISMSPGEMLATLRQLQELTQNELAKLTGMTQANISNMESGRQKIGLDRAITLATALKVHPAVIVFPSYQMDTPKDYFSVKSPPELKDLGFSTNSNYVTDSFRKGFSSSWGELDTYVSSASSSETVLH